MSMRLRRALAPIVTILLVMQSVMPGALAQHEVNATPEPIVVVEGNDSAEPVGEADEAGVDETQEAGEQDSVADGDVVGGGEDPVEDEDAGSAGDETQEPVNDESDQEADTDDAATAEPEATEEVETPADSGTAEDDEEADDSANGDEGDDAESDVEGDNKNAAEGTAETEEKIKSDEALATGTPEIKHAPMATDNALPGVTGVSVPSALENMCDDLRIDGTWQVDNPTAGDRFTFTFDSRLKVSPGLPRAMVDKDNPGVIVGYITVSGNVGTFELSSAVDGRASVQGTFFLISSGCWGGDFAGQNLTLNFSGSNGQTWERAVEIPEAPPAPVKVDPTKAGVLEDDGDTITWTVYFPEGPANSATIRDLAGTDWTFVPGSFVGTEGGGATPTVVENEDGSITVNVGAYTAEGIPGFTIKATVAEEFRGDLEAGTSHEFSNTITGTITGLDGVEVPMTEVTAKVEKEGPEVVHPVGTEPNKQGTFTRDDQGRLNPNGAIRWTVYFPAGSSGGATITDTVPDGAGWQFDLESFRPLNHGGATVTLDTDASSTTKIVVRTSGYNTMTEPPGFVIDATITDPSAVSFPNSVTAVNTNMDGEPAGEGSKTIEVPRTEVPPSTYSPRKSGRFTSGETITWTVLFPAGSAEEATLTDLALPGWKFDLTSFRPINTGAAVVSLSDSSSPDSITVSVGKYIARANPPGFTIQATLVDGWEDLVEYDAETGQAIFKNTATVTTTPYGGGEAETRSVTAAVKKPLPPDTPEPGENPSKSGEWTDPSNQGFDRAGAIKWTVMAPHGPASSATITDNAGDNWVFDCDTSTPKNSITLINGDGVESFDVECTPNKLVVTFTNITSGESAPVGFTVSASTTVPFTDGQGFNNTAVSVINSVDGEITKRGSVTSDWLIQDSTFGGDAGSGIRVLPMAPTVTDTVCENGVEPNPTIVLPENSTDITYEKVQEVDLATGDYVVKATKTESKEWGLLTGGWSVNPENPNEAIYNGNVDIVPCESSIVELVLPTADAAVCEGGVDPDPTKSTVTTGENTDLVSYEVTSPINAEGVYVVTATKSADAEWPADLGAWVPVEGNPNQVTYTGQVEIVPCDTVDLVLPTADAAVCEGGVDPDPTKSTVTTGENTDLVSYEVTSPINAEGVYVVTATKNADAKWPVDLGAWVPVEGNPNQVTYTGQVEIVPCDTVDLVLPTADAAVCEGGVDPDPTKSTVTTGENTDLVSYEVTSPINAEGVYVVTATKNADAKWPADLGAWGPVEGNPNQVTYTGQVEIVPCDTLELVLPTADAAVCEGGVDPDPTRSTVTTGENSDLVSYEITSPINADGAYVVTATKNADAKWPVDLGAWVPVEGNPNQVTYTGQVEIVPCDPVAPVAPTIEGNVCEGGAYTPATAIAATGPEGVTYSEVEAAGGRITATATLSSGQKWDTTGFVAPGELGWSVDSTNPSVAHYIGSYQEAPCAPVVPVNPIVEQAICTGGKLVKPMVIVVDTDRITYTKSGEEVPGGTVIVTATLAEGFSWDVDDMPDGWTVNPENPTEATFVVELADISCTPVVPGKPVVKPAVCKHGKLVPPAIELPTTPGVTYTKDGKEAPGGTVVITAKLSDGYAWGDLPEGWTLVDATTATFTVTFDTVSCEAPKPKPETPGKVTNLPSTGSGIDNAGTGMIMASMAGLMLTAVAVRMHASRRA